MERCQNDVTEEPARGLEVEVEREKGERCKMIHALRFVRDRSRRAQDAILHLVEEAEPFLEFHGESPAEADQHRRTIAQLSELHVLLARMEIKALHALPIDSGEDE